ncbi:hypothetical protein NLI96_g4965 [Meripilus lineatus]|uniref:2,5-diamino-6-ribosylamino-4(3H)-pyrimidinone 5'-phosphate reductase n=1 Tax=Meripilus lineatus TaxID=2056292 RepID=A0AAD5V3X0_9APHY|nr:hypothetical protein NLI96_g4965 [Physisporinus lineatus]
MDPPHQPPKFLLGVLEPTISGTTPISIFAGDEGLSPSPTSPQEDRPFVTLTFAQSLDAKIAGVGGKQLALSGKESMVMTHWMRTMHDAILVGVGTALNDNPQLNTRHLPPLPGGSDIKYSLPRPIVLDTNLRSSAESKLLGNYRRGVGRRPWIIASAPEGSSGAATSWNEKKLALEQAGAKVVNVQSSEGRISIPHFLKTLRELGIRSLMVEGGADVIRSFLAAASPSTISSPAVDAIIVTVAPMFVGDAGVGYGRGLRTDQLPKLGLGKSEVFGRDSVIAMKVLS